MKITILDLECSPAKAYVWGKYDQNIVKLIDDWHLLAFSHKELGSKRSYFYGLNTMTERQLTKKLWEVFNESDVIIAHNAKAFDVKKSKAKFIEYGLPPPSSYEVVDTLTIARKHFKFIGNSLEDLATLFNLGKKIKHNGHDLFIQCLETKNKKIWNLMKRYNVMDILLLEKVYKILLPYIDNHPNYNVYTGSMHNCPNCGSDKLMKEGCRYTRTGKKQQYRCKNCQSWSTAGKILN